MAKETKPPYISVQRLTKALDLISNRNLGNISVAIFEQYDFGSDAVLAVSALRFLGVIDDKGNPTPVMQGLRLKGEARKKVFEDIVRSSYKTLFDRCENPYALGKDELTNEFTLSYDLSPRVARTTVPAFFKLSEFAGLSEEKPPRKERVKNEKSKMQKPPVKVRAHDTVFVSNSDSHVQVISKGKMNITIPEEVFLRSATDDDLNDAWRNVLKSAHKFADLYLKDETPTDSGGGSS